MRKKRGTGREHPFFFRVWTLVCGIIVVLYAHTREGIRRHPAVWATGAGTALVALVLLPFILGSPLSDEARAGSQPIYAMEPVELTYDDQSYEDEVYGDGGAPWDWSQYFRSLRDAELAELEAQKPSIYKRGDEGPEINRIQERLMELDYFGADETTDFYGSVTEMAVQLFQRSNKLEVDGVVGQETWDLLFSDDAMPYLIFLGNKGGDVEESQRRLYELGYLSSRSKITGFFGEDTDKAVRAFQTRNKLTVDGIIGTRTNDMLFSPRAKPAYTPTPSKSASPGGSSKSSTKIDKMIEAGKAKRGSKYVFSATGPNSFDCSGFVYYCLKQAGMSISRYNAAGYAEVDNWKKISSVSSLKKGDLIFWRSPGSSRVSHTGIYLGGGEFIHASSGQGKVLISSFSDYWRTNFVCGRRPFG